VTAIKSKKGWFVELKEMDTSAPTGSPATWPWVGEKSLAKPVIFDGALYVTTYTPASNTTAQITCAAAEGLARLHTYNILNAAAIVDYDNSNTLTTTDRTKNLGGGIPSELVTVIREGGTTALVGTSGGAASPKIDSKLPRFKTFWYEE
jgi:type IV pilus assembly protein PilY1